MQVIISALLLAVLPGPAQTTQTRPPAKNQQKESEAKRQLKVFSLRHAQAKQALNTLMPFVGDTIRLSVDERTNSVIAHGTADDLMALEALLEQVDRPNEKTKASYTVIKVQSDVRAIDNTLRTLVGDARIVSDAVTNSLIISGTPDQIKAIKSLVEVLDAPKPVAKSKQYKLRVVWLLSNGEGKPLPKDLGPVVASLEKIGISDLKMVTQSLVNVSDPGSPFDVSGTTDESGQTLRLSGERSNQDREKGPIKVELSVQAQPLKQKEPVVVEAAISLTPGQTAVLGVTQTGTGNSAFIVQLVEGL